MTDDPKRWVDDEGAPPAMREFLRDARLEAPTLDAEARARVRRRIVRSAPTGFRLAGVVVMAAATAAALLLVLWSSRPTSHPMPAIARERDASVGDAGPTDAAAALESIRMERTCGDEAADYACTVDVEMARPHERVEIRFAWGIAPPACDGPPLEADRIERVSDTHLVVDDDDRYEAHFALRACAYDGAALVATGAIEGTRSVPGLETRSVVSAAGATSVDLRLSLDGGDVDDDVVSFAIVRQPYDEAAREAGLPSSCEGDIVLEIPSTLVLSFEAQERVALPIHLDEAASPDVVFVVCARDASGALTTETTEPSRPWIQDYVPNVLTPSGDIPISELELGHRVLMRVPAAQPPYARPGPVFTSVVGRIESESDPVIHRLRLEDGRSALLPSFVRAWCVERGAFVALDELHVGEHVVDEHDRDVAIEEVTSPEDVHGWYVEPVLADPASYFLDGILVEGRHTRPRTLALGSLPPPASVEAWPATPDDCSLRSMLELESLDALAVQGATAVAIVFAPHRGAPGALQEVDCATARVGFEAGFEDLAHVPVDAEGRRRLSIDMPALRAMDDLAPDREIECDAGYAVMACVRDASGLRALPGAQGRWTRSGPSCFAASTLVTTAQGARPIASLHRGDRVEAYDPRAHRTSMARVERLISRGERPILALALSSGLVLRVTAEHPLLDARTESFRDAGSFAVGDALRARDGTEVLVVDVGDGGRAQVYDLSVTNPHTFVASGIVAHNY